jgi:heterodisulfide reductase subunit A-like polyferredoxin
MTEGLVIRLAILIVGAAVATISAVLGFAEALPFEMKVILVAANAGLGFVMNQLASWQAAPAADRAMRKAQVD